MHSCLPGTERHCSALAWSLQQTVLPKTVFVCIGMFSKNRGFRVPELKWHSSAALFCYFFLFSNVILELTNKKISVVNSGAELSSSAAQRVQLHLLYNVDALLSKQSCNIKVTLVIQIASKLQTQFLFCQI